MTGPVGQIFNFVPDVSSSTQASASLYKLLDQEPKIDAEDPSGEKVDHVQGQLHFRNVHFRYANRPETRVLRGLNLTVKPGQFAAIVGPSGSGKSTTIQLICRFYDPLSGEVLLDDSNIVDLNVAQYRSHIALVPLPDCLLYNIRLLISHFYRCLKNLLCIV